ncbi:MAG: MBOAT family protein [Ruminococcaceae bacterium]|nr:MBOAT family protein [Oscillospiraceae bacterium]
MSFVSVKFVFFLAAVFAVYFLWPKRLREHKWIVLLVFSLIFYAFGGVKYFIYIGFTAVTSFIIARQMSKFNTEAENVLAENKDWPLAEKKEYRAKVKSKNKKLLLLDLVLNIGLLVFMKYYNFIAENINAVLGIVSIDPVFGELELILPLGISFYTFQSTGYVVDVYRNKYKADTNFAKFALFVSFFPQIIQGPIGRHDQLAHQLYEPHDFDFTRFKHGCELIIWGAFKKLVIADRVGMLVDHVFQVNPAEYDPAFGGIAVIVATLFCGIRIYGDFSGGIDIARGVAQILGIDLAENFKRPFFATSVADFWRRWHITLGDWMKDYVFYPIAISKGMAKATKKIKARFGNFAAKSFAPCIASFVSFFLVGIWHAASWKYVVFGIYNGAIIAAAIWFDPLFKKIKAKLNINDECFSWKLFSAVRTLLLVSVARLESMPSGLKNAWLFFKRIFTHWDPWVLVNGEIYTYGMTFRDFGLTFLCLIVLLVVGILQEKGYSIREKLDKQQRWFRWMIIIAGIFAVLVFGLYGPGYNASDFVYERF